MSLAITESWIRERIQLTEECLDDIKSLSLPGTYHEKITNLGNSLYHFSRLKELDLSRNALENLDGLQHLKVLESLNLYYNNVTTLAEVHKLRNNYSLQELDLRLNPVARNEPDYRLFVIHMLPNLRRLDDRGVRDQERKAALMHFASDQAVEFRAPSRDISTETMSSERLPLAPRADYVSKMSYVPPIETDDVSLIDHAQRLDLNRPPSRNRGADMYDRRELLAVERRGARNFSGDSDSVLNSTRSTAYPLAVDQYYSQLKASKAAPLFTAAPSLQDGRSESTPPPPSLEPRPSATISRLCDLVDRYWNGSRSLHTHPKFLSNAAAILSEQGGQRGEPAHVRVTADLERELDDLRQRLRAVDAENARLREEKSAARAGSRAQESTADLERDNERLRSEVSALRSRLRSFEQNSDLTSMLKESHRALVETNDQLKRELNELRSKLVLHDGATHLNGNGASMALAK